MSHFDIQFYPRLPQAPLRNDSIVPSAIDWQTVLIRIPQTYDVEYNINNMKIRYYPSQIITVFEDLWAALKHFQERQPHTMVLAGYPVLDVVFNNSNSVLFYHADELAFLGRRPINGPIDAPRVERALAAAVRQVWSVVKAAE